MFQKYMLTPLLCNIAVTGLAGTEEGGLMQTIKKQGRLTVTLPLACCLLNIYSVFIGKLRMKKYSVYLFVGVVSWMSDFLVS